MHKCILNVLLSLYAAEGRDNVTIFLNGLVVLLCSRCTASTAKSRLIFNRVFHASSVRCFNFYCLDFSLILMALFCLCLRERTYFLILQLNQFWVEKIWIVRIKIVTWCSPLSCENRFADGLLWWKIFHRQ